MAAKSARARKRRKPLALQKSAAPARRRQAPRLADVVAAELRQRILSGGLREGALLPKQEHLLAEFQVSPPSIREALRILESEGLVTVLRGNVGGAVVHAPSSANAAFTIASVLQSRRVRLEDVGHALQAVEPACVAAAAARRDRHDLVLPELRALHEEELGTLEQPERYRDVARRMHEAFVRASGNETLALLAGSLEALWAAHASRRARAGRWPTPVTPAVRASYVRAHALLIDAIADGDADRARHLAQQHLAKATRHTLTDADEIGIDASLLAPR